MVGCLGLVSLVSVLLGLTRWVNLLIGLSSRLGEVIPIALASGLPPDFGDAEDLASWTGDYPGVWTDGSMESYPSAGESVAGAGVYLPVPELAVQGAVWEEGRGGRKGREGGEREGRRKG